MDRLGETREAHRVDGGAASVDRRRRRLLAGEPLDDVADVHLQRDARDRGSRPGPSRSRCRPAASRRACPSSSSGCARAGVVADEFVAGGLISGPGGGAGERAPRRGGRRRGCRAPPRRGDPCPNGSRWPAPARSPSSGAPAVRQARACSGLRLERGGRGAGSPSCSTTMPSGDEDDRGSAVPGFDESAAFDDGQLDGVGGGEGLRHHASLPSAAPARCRVRDWGACSASIATVCSRPGPATADRGRPATATTTAPSTIEIDGKPTLHASSDKPFRGDPARWNPEDLLLASLSECHLLSYLHACVQAGVVVVDYRDEASGLMVEDGRGGGRFTRGPPAAARDGRRCIDDGCRDRGPCAGQRVVLHRELGELPGGTSRRSRSPRLAEAPRTRRRRVSGARAAGPA